MEDHFVQIGTREIWGGHHAFGLSRADRRHHTYIIGKTRTGKTTLIKSLALQDMMQYAGVCFIDPHGDAAETLVRSGQFRREVRA